MLNGRQTHWIISWCSKLKPEVVNQPKDCLFTMMGFQILLSSIGLHISGDKVATLGAQIFELFLVITSHPPVIIGPKGLEHTALNEVILD